MWARVNHTLFSKKDNALVWKKIGVARLESYPPHFVGLKGLDDRQQFEKGVGFWQMVQ